MRDNGNTSGAFRIVRSKHEHIHVGMVPDDVSVLFSKIHMFKLFGCLTR